jgi:peptidoglycan/LPS O-acetylase OafA/YrhL
MGFVWRFIGCKPGDTIGSVLDRNRGVGPGFDWLRIGLSLLIFYSHAKYIAGNILSTQAEPAPLSHHTASIAVTSHATPAALLGAEGGWSGWHRPIAVALVPMFFALSGFLVTGSALRLKRTSTFLAFRVIRILPALGTEVALSALVLGPAVTVMALSDYYRDPLLFRYFANIAGVISYRLPGVFVNNPATDAVNLNLWTLPGEFYCYAALAFCMIVGLVYRRRFFLVALVILSCVLAPLNLFTDFDVVPTALPTHALAIYFLVGVALFQWRDHIPVHPGLFVLCGSLAFTMLLSRHTVYLVPPLLGYCTVFIGMMSLPKSRLLASGDYSYGIYLYGFPIMQATMVAMPWLRGHWGWLMVIAGTFTCLFAAASWHLIEKPALKLKAFLPKALFPRAPRALPLEAHLV